MVAGENNERVVFVNLATGFASYRMVDGVERLISISHTDMEDRYRESTIEHIIYINLGWSIPIVQLDLEVML